MSAAIDTALDAAIMAMTDATDAYARARDVETMLEDARPIVKQSAIMRIMQSPNDLTGKPHSASSAEAVVELDELYADHRLEQRIAAIRTITARAQRIAAEARVWACVSPEGMLG